MWRVRVGLRQFSVIHHKKLPLHVNLSRLMFHHVEIFAAEMILANMGPVGEEEEK